MATRAAKVTASVNIAGEIALTPSTTDGGSLAKANMTIGQDIVLLDGTGAGQVRQVWRKKFEGLATSSDTDLDLSDLNGIDIGQGAGEDAVGQTWDPTTLVGLVVHNLTPVTATATVRVEAEVGSVVFLALSDAIDLPTGAMMFWLASQNGDAISSGDTIRVTNLDGTNTADVEVMLLAR